MTSTRTKLQALAAILLEDDAARFERLCNQLLDDPEGFQRDGHAHAYDLASEELEDPQNPLWPALVLLMAFAYEEGYSQSEPDAEGFEIWVAARAHALTGRSMDLDFVDDWMEAHAGERNILSDYFKMLGAHLVPWGLDLIFLDRGDDAYEPFVIRSVDLQRLPEFDDADEAALGWARMQRWDDPAV
jgi:hypothetical protein